MSNNPVSGGSYLLRGLGLITQPGVRRFVAIPLAINILIFALLFWLATGYFTEWVDSIAPQWEWFAWLSDLLWVVFAGMLLVVLFFSFSLLANIIAAPFNGLLAEAVERKLTGREPPSGDWGELLKQAPGMILDELGKLGYYLLWFLLLLILTFIPPISAAAPVIWPLFSAWMLAIQYCDYPLGNHELRGGEQRRILREQRWLSLGFGGATLLATLVPILNFLVMPTAVAGATAMSVERLLREGESLSE